MDTFSVLDTKFLIAGAAWGSVLGASFLGAALLAHAASTPSTGAVAAGENFSLGLKSHGIVWAWGRNDAGYLGDCTTQHANAKGSESYLRHTELPGTISSCNFCAGHHHRPQALPPARNLHLAMQFRRSFRR